MSHNCLYLRIVFLGATDIEEGQKSRVRIGKGCMCIKGWLKPIFPSLGLRLLRQLQVLIPVVDFALPPFPIAIRHVTHVGNMHGF